MLETIGFLLFVFAVVFVALFTQAPPKNGHDKAPPAEKDGKNTDSRDR